MSKITLNGQWNVAYDNISKQVMVPGVIERDLEKRDTFTSFRYQRSFQLNKQEHMVYLLHCEGISYHASIYVNQQFVKEVEGIWQPHILELQEYLQDGENTIELIIQKPDFDKQSRFYYRSVLFGFIPDVLFPFGGIYKDIYIEEKQQAYFKDSALYLAYETCSIVLESACPQADCEVELLVDGQLITRIPYEHKLTVPLQDAAPWSPANPRLYQVEARLIQHDHVVDSVSERLGYRRITMKDDELYLNEQPIHFRAILHWGYYPEHMEVVPDKQRAKKELLDLKAQGFQAIKFCLFLPPSYYFDLCDELGILVWQELPLWLPYDNGFLFDRIHTQYPAIMSQCRSHASLFMISIGCELDTTIPKETLDDLYYQLSALRTEAIVCDNSGSGECYDGALQSESDIYDYHFYGELHNMQTLLHEFKHASRKKKPWFFGEYNDMDSFRDLIALKEQSDEELFWANPDPSQNLLRYVHANAVSDMPIYDYENITRENELQKDMPQLISCAKQKAYDVRKYNLETTRKNDVNGYSITAIRDVPITSCGIFDDLGNKKWSDEAMQSINGDLVLSLSAPLKRKWHNGADVFQTLDEYNFLSGTALQHRVHLSNHTGLQGEAVLSVNLWDGSACVRSYIEEFPLAGYASLQIAQLQVNLPEVVQAKQLTLQLSVHQGTTQLSENSWSIWVYPIQETRVQLYDPTGVLEGIEEVMKVCYVSSIEEIQAGVLVTTVLDDDMLARLPKRCSLVYLQTGHGYFPIQREPFWRECVRLIQPHTFFDRLATKGYDSLQFISFTSDVTILAKDVKQVAGTYQQMMSRIDNRRFHRSECIFTFEKAGHQIMTCTIGFRKGSGTQARSIVENIFAQQVLHEMIQEMEGAVCC